MPVSWATGRRGLHTADDKGRDGVSRRDIRNGCSYWSVGRNWQRGHWCHTVKPSTEWRKGGQSRWATWVVTPRMGRYLGGFQDQVMQQITGGILQKKTDGKWEYTLAAAVVAR